MIYKNLLYFEPLAAAVFLLYVNLVKLAIALRSADARDELCPATLTVAFSQPTLWLEAAQPATIWA